MNSDLAFLSLLLFGSLFVLLMLGLPLVYCLFGIAIIGLYILEGPKAYLLVYYNIIGNDRFWVLIAVPLFIFMAGMFERSGVAEDLYRTIQVWSSSIAGGLAMGTVFISTILSAMVGLSSAALLTTGIIALPAMLKRGYHKSIAMGSILAGGALGILIPPSVVMVVYATEGGVFGVEASVSVGKLFLAGILPGILLSSLFIIYIGVRCYFQPALAPLPAATEHYSWRQRFNSLWSLLIPAVLVLLVLGSIIAGVTTASEAAALGAAGAIVSAAIYRRLTWQNLKEVCFMTLKLSSMIMWILIAGRCFRALYYLSGAVTLLQNGILELPFGSWGILMAIQLTLIILGCFLDPFGIIMITVPISAPIIEALGFDPVWFGILFIINMEMAYLTPPVGLNIFYLKSIVPEGITMMDIYRSVVPFVLIQVAVLVLIILFPKIATWLPNLMIE